VHHTFSCFSFPLAISYNYIINAANCDWTWAIHVLISLMGDASSYVEIFSASAWVTILYYVKGKCMCDNNPAINNSLCCTSGIWNDNRSFSTLNIWSKSQTNSFIIFLISFISVMHYDSDLGFWNSFNSNWFTSTHVLVCLACVVFWYFMYHNSTHSMKVVSNYAVFTSSS